jgi:chromosome partitioning protein
MVEPFERDRLPRLNAILSGLAGTGFTLAIFDTAGADSAAVSLVAEAADLCLLPSRPTRLDVEATAMTFRAAFLANRKAAFVLNQCPPNYRSARATDAAKELTNLANLGVLAEPLLSARMDYQDALAGGFGVTEFSRDGRAAREVEALWRWSYLQIGPAVELPAANQNKNRDVVAAA